MTRETPGRPYRTKSEVAIEIPHPMQVDPLDWVTPLM